MVKLENRMFGLHTLSAILFHGIKAEHKIWALHRCGLKGCCNPAHIYVGDAQDNSRDERYRRKNSVSKDEIINRPEELDVTAEFLT
jgi:hypothetical protein